MDKEESIVSKDETNTSSVEVKTTLNTVTPFSKYLAMGLFILLTFVGFWLGTTYQPDSNKDYTPTQSSPENQTILSTKERIIKDLTEATVPDGLNSPVHFFQPSVLKTESRLLGDVFTMTAPWNFIDTDVRLYVEPLDGIVTRSEMGQIEMPERFRDIFEFQHKLTNIVDHGTVLSNATNTPYRLSWVSVVNQEPMLFSVDLGESYLHNQFEPYKQTHAEKVQRSTFRTLEAENTEGLEITVNDGTREGAVIQYLMTTYPPNNELTENFDKNLETERNTKQGWAYEKVISKASGESGQSFTVTVFDNQNSNYSGTGGGCGWFLTGEIGNPARLSCVVEIETSNSQTTFKDEEIKELGGIPQNWLSDNEILVSNNFCSDLCDSDVITGVYYSDTKQYQTFLEYTSRSLYCEQKWVGMDYLGQKLVLLMGDWNNGTSTLYELNYNGTMEQFIDNQLSSEQYCELDFEIESTPSELNEIGEIPHCSWSQLTQLGISKEIDTGAYMLNLQGCEGGDIYNYNPTTRNLEVSGM